jgi:hypothetical protein
MMLLIERFGVAGRLIRAWQEGSTIADCHDCQGALIAINARSA